MHADRGRRPRDRALAGLLGLAVMPAGVAAATPTPPPAPPGAATFVHVATGGVVVERLPVAPRGTATVALLRGGAVVAVVSGPPVEGVGDGAGLVAGGPGRCWTDADGRPVDPRPVPGDVVAVAFDGSPLGTTTIPDAAVDGPPKVHGGTVVVRGHVPAGVDPAAVEHHVVDAGLVGTDVGRGDVRAAPGPPVRGPGGAYVSQLVVTGTELTATYLFDDPATAARVARAPASRLTIRSDTAPGAPGGAVVAGPPAPGRPCDAGATPRVPEAVPVASPSGVVLVAPPGLEVYYTTDGSDPRHGDLPSPTARRHAGLVVVPAPRTPLAWTVFDPATGLFGPRRTAIVDPPPP